MNADTFARRGDKIRELWQRRLARFGAAVSVTLMSASRQEIGQQAAETRASTYHEDSVIDEEIAGAASPVEDRYEVAPRQGFLPHDDSVLNERERRQLARDLGLHRFKRAATPAFLLLPA